MSDAAKAGRRKAKSKAGKWKLRFPKLSPIKKNKTRRDPNIDQSHHKHEQTLVWIDPRKSYLFPSLSSVAHQIAMTHTHGTHRGGLDFYTLARGGERSYSCSFLVNLDPDLLSLCSREDATPLDLARDALISHTKRIFKFIQMKSGREVNQFCFGSTYVQLNPNYRRFERMEPMTWKKEGIASHWTGMRGFRKSCCKVCCQDRNCTGCKSCRHCVNGPTRGNYDGLVVLTAVTRESLPNQPVYVASRKSISQRKAEEKLPDHEMFAISLETLLSTHFMYGDPDYQTKCVPTSRTSILLGETVDDLRKHKKYSGYVVYVAYRLGPHASISHSQRLSRVSTTNHRELQERNAAAIQETDEEGPGSVGNRTDDDERGRSSPEQPFNGYGGGGHFEIDEDDDIDFTQFDDGPNQFGNDEDDEKLLEDLEDKQLLARIKDLESENSSLTEKVWKLEHGRTWVENRLTALETEVTTLKGAPLASMPSLRESE